MQNLNSTHKRNILIIASISALIALMVFKTTNAESSNDDSKSVAWYVSNIKVAQAKNTECRADINNLKTTPDCLNALSALQMSFK
jgi:hypothetical protein